VPTGDSSDPDEFRGVAPVHRELLHVVEDYERLWAVAGFAEHFAAHLAQPTSPLAGDDPYRAVLIEHRQRLIEALRDSRRVGNLADSQDLGELADALLGFYLGRRLACSPLDGWAQAAIATVID
jgi:hypothetical protein